MPAPKQGTLVTVVGGDESEEFHRQAELIAKAWGRRVVVGAERPAHRNHMSVLADLADPASGTHRQALGLLGLAVPAR